MAYMLGTPPTDNSSSSRTVRRAYKTREIPPGEHLAFPFTDNSNTIPASDLQFSAPSSLRCDLYVVYWAPKRHICWPIDSYLELPRSSRSQYQISYRLAILFLPRCNHVPICPSQSASGLSRYRSKRGRLNADPNPHLTHQYKDHQENCSPLREFTIT